MGSLHRRSWRARAWRGRITAAIAATGTATLLAGFVVMGTAGTAQANGNGNGEGGPPADPGGNNGTVKVAESDDLEESPQPDNNPHLPCTFDIQWYGYGMPDDSDDPAFTGKVTFELQAPTADGQTLTVTQGSTTQVLDKDAAGGGTDLDADETYTLAFTGDPHMAGDDPDKQGFHVKITVETELAHHTQKKHKVFWVGPCDDDEEEEPEQPDPVTNTSSSSRTDCTTATVVTTTTTTRTEYVKNQAGDWVLGTPQVISTSTSSRPATNGELNQADCPRPDRPSPIVTTTAADDVDCEDNVVTTTTTTTTVDWVFDESSRTWVKGQPQVSTVRTVRDATEAECPVEVLPSEAVDVCPNIAGDQEAVPEGYSMKNGKCIEDEVKGVETEKPEPTIRPVVNEPPEVVPTAVDAGFGPAAATAQGSLLGQALVGAGLMMLLLAGTMQMGRRERGVHEA
ncbi:MAG TPA: hypothetical protein VGD51_14870 [Nocardioidaceae bacterium]